MKFKFTSAALLLMMLPLLSIAQSHKTNRTVFGQTVQSVNPKNGLIRCLSTEYEQALQQKNPNRANREVFENWLAPKVAAAKQNITNKVSAVVTIPVVVHVIHNGDAVGSNENISDARVLSQITVLNQDFRRMAGTPGYNTNTVGADMEIEFVMAKRKPDGTATNGIDRVQMSRASWASESSIENQLKPQTSWDPTQYFNIWVCAFSDNENDEMYGTLGYAQFPSTSGLGGLDANGGDADTDGVILDYRCFGTSTIAPSSNYFEDYDKGRTLTHEIGHCFGLIHIWGDNSSCTVNATDSAQDFCPDTPAAREEHYDCLRTYNTCTAAAGNDMVENYMDYTNDTCMNIFTLDQKGRVLAVLQNSPRRAELTSSTVGQTLAATSFDALATINLYPNPATAVVNIHANASNMPKSYAVYNSIGQLIAAAKISSVSDLTISTSAYNNGVYFIKLTKDDAVKTLQFVKN